MEITTVVNVNHADPSLLLDSVESVSYYVSKNIIAIADKKYWEIFNLNLQQEKICGSSNPSVNLTLALQHLWSNHSESDWFCFVDANTIFASSRFRYNLNLANEMNVWMLGNNGEISDYNMELVESMLDIKITSSYKLSNLFLFFSRNFLSKLFELNFFERFLNLASGVSLPASLGEFLYPTLCRRLGGNIGVLATWDGSEWHGSSQYYPVCKNLNLDDFDYSNASIIGPIKNMDHPVREYCRKVRYATRESVGCYL